jgi:glycosyltransferase involved in cell wall biosynthesis
MNVGVIIPALNEQDCIAATIRRLPAGFAAQIIVADNGSTDATAERARQAGAEVVSEPRRGYGQACLTGLAQLRPDIEAVAFLDADGSDDPAELSRLLEPIVAGEADLVIGSLANGFQTAVGERGSNLSLGQRQLICFIRALVADPRILILDEATSSVDSLTEARIQSALAKLLRDRTSFVVAHRLSTIRHADLVLVLDHGQIVERGTHDTLLAQGGVYAGLYRQFVRATEG